MSLTTPGLWIDPQSCGSMEKDVDVDDIDGSRFIREDESVDNPEFSSYEEDSDFDCNHEREGGGISKTGDDSETKKLKCHNSDEERLCLGSNADGHFRDEALSNVLILQKIFSHFKTKFLLSSVSLVSKTWNREARIFIHNYRNCLVRRPGVDKIPNCQFFRELDKLCCQMRQSRRLVPWNLLQLNFNEYSKECFKKFYDSDDYNDVMDKQMVDRLKVKYLEICGVGGLEDCPAHKPVLTFLRHASCKLRRLKIKHVFHLEPLFRHWQPHFPVLEEIMISSSTYNIQEQADILKRLLDAAPKLKKINYSGVTTLKIIPEEKLGLLDDLILQFQDSSLEDDNIVWNIVEKKPALRTLWLYNPPNNSVPKFNKLLKQIYQACHESLKFIAAFSPAALEKLSPLSFPNLSSMILQNEGSGNIHEFWKAFTAIDFCKNTPRLEDVLISFIVDDRGVRKIEWPKGSETTDGLHSCPTVRKLELDLDIDKINFSQIKIVFPNVSALKLIVEDGVLYNSDLPSLTEIWELYPLLQDLKIKGEGNKLKYNFDSQFCGIFDEEVELLRENDEEYLQAVHIIPIRPSVLTMPNLRMLWVDLKFDPEPDLDNLERNRLTFTSKVTEFLAFKRMKHAKVRVCGVVGLNDIDELDDSDDQVSDVDESDSDDWASDEVDSSDDNSSGGEDGEEGQEHNHVNEDVGN